MSATPPCSARSTMLTTCYARAKEWPPLCLSTTVQKQGASSPCRSPQSDSPEPGIDTQSSGRHAGLALTPRQASRIVFEAGSGGDTLSPPQEFDCPTRASSNLCYVIPCPVSIPSAGILPKSVQLRCARSCTLVRGHFPIAQRIPLLRIARLPSGGRGQRFKSSHLDQRFRGSADCRLCPTTGVELRHSRRPRAAWDRQGQ